MKKSLYFLYLFCIKKLYCYGQVLFAHNFGGIKSNLNIVYFPFN